MASTRRRPRDPLQRLTPSGIVPRCRWRARIRRCREQDRRARGNGRRRRAHGPRDPFAVRRPAVGRGRGRAAAHAARAVALRRHAHRIRQSVVPRARRRSDVDRRRDHHRVARARDRVPGGRRDRHAAPPSHPVPARRWRSQVRSRPASPTSSTASRPSRRPASSTSTTRSVGWPARGSRVVPASPRSRRSSPPRHRG